MDGCNNRKQHRDFFAAEVSDEHSFRELLRNICQEEEDEADDADDDDDDYDESDYEYDDDGENGDGDENSCQRPSWYQVCSYDADDCSDGSSQPQTRQQQRREGRRHRKKKENKKRKALRMHSIVGFRAQYAQLNQLRHDILARRKVAAAAVTTTIPADTTADTAASEASPRPEEAEEETEEQHAAVAKAAMKTWNEGNGGDGKHGGGTDDKSEGVRDQENVDAGGVEGRGAGDDRGGRALGAGNDVDVGGTTFPSSGAIGEADGCNGGSGGRTTFPMIMRICGEESRGERQVENSCRFPRRRQREHKRKQPTIFWSSWQQQEGGGQQRAPTETATTGPTRPDFEDCFRGKVTGTACRGQIGRWRRRRAAASRGAERATTRQGRAVDEGEERDMGRGRRRGEAETIRA